MPIFALIQFEQDSTLEVLDCVKLQPLDLDLDNDVIKAGSYVLTLWGGPKKEKKYKALVLKCSGRYFRSVNIRIVINRNFVIVL